MRITTATAVILALEFAGCAPQSTAAMHFTDVTAQSGIDLVVTSGRSPSSQILEVKGGGLALIDFDNDGDLDVFVPNGATLDRPRSGPGCRLFRNEGGLRFVDATTNAGLDFRRWGFGVAVADYDGDGWDDLFVACYGLNALLRNEQGRFREVTGEAGIAGDSWSTDAAFGDTDGDGDLDLYVVNFLEFDTNAPPEHVTYYGADVFAGPRGLPAQPDVLYENTGDGRFVDISVASGCRTVEPGYGLGVLILDFDSNGKNEIFVGNDSGTNFLFTPDSEGKFNDVGIQSGIALNDEGVEQATMGIALGDVTGNGLPDVYTSNFMNDTNTLHANLGGLLFEDQTQQFGLRMATRPYLGWAAMLCDFDHDADEDLLVFNGHVYPRSITDPRDWGHVQTPLLYERDGRRLRRVGAESAGSWLAAEHCDRSAAFGDLDQDGDMDVVVGELNGPLRVLENDGAPGHWLIVSLVDERDTSQNRRGLGSRVELTSGETRQTRWIHGKGSYQSANAPYAHFGLGDSAASVLLEVTWPDGQTSTVQEVAVDRHQKISHP